MFGSTFSRRFMYVLSEYVYRLRVILAKENINLTFPLNGKKKMYSLSYLYSYIILRTRTCRKIVTG